MYVKKSREQGGWQKSILASHGRRVLLVDKEK
jgi:hypothetical protein